MRLFLSLILAAGMSLVFTGCHHHHHAPPPPPPPPPPKHHVHHHHDTHASDGLCTIGASILGGIVGAIIGAAM